jgi:biopolymer transport protein ExbD
MAFGGFSQGEARAPQSDINMTPLIDVMLVLLIIFMVTAPLLTARLPLDLPKANAPLAATPPAALQVALRADGRVYLDEQPSTLAALANRAAALARQQPDTEVQLRADRNTRYEVIAEVMAEARSAGIEKMGFVTVPER